MGFHFNQKFSATVSVTRLRVYRSLYFSSLSNDGLSAPLVPKRFSLSWTPVSVCLTHTWDEP